MHSAIPTLNLPFRRSNAHDTIRLIFAAKKNKNLHRAHFVLTTSDAAFTSTYLERG
jgi:hypothetical protein